MAQTANNTSSSVRQAALERRRAMAQSGKAAIATGNGGQASGASANDAAATAAAQPSGEGSGQGARIASRARRQAMASKGKAGVVSKDRTRADDEASAGTGAPAPATPPEAASKDGDNRDGCGCGCKGRKDENDPNGDTGSQESNGGAPEARRSTARIRARVRNAGAQTQSAGRAASVARRKSMAARGKAGVSSQGLTPAQTARAANPQMSGRELAQTLREQRSRKGAAGQKSSESAGRIRRRRCNGAAAAEDAPWKVGASETVDGQTVTGTMVGRSENTTGDEASTCRPVTGTEYMGADVFRQFCQSDPLPTPAKIGVSETGRGQKVSGSRVGRGEQVTGNESGSCKRVTGNEYLGADHSEKYCGTRAEASPTRVTGAETRRGQSVSGNNVGRAGKVTGDETGAGRELTGSQYMMPGQEKGRGTVPAKVGRSETLRGGSTTGTQMGRSERVTGDEPGSCRNVTGDDYVGKEQYSNFCESTPKPQDQKVGQSSTQSGKGVTGTMTGRGSRVTGDEPGTCTAVTGTPYAGVEQYQTWCSPEQSALAQARTRQQRGTPGAVMTGQQPAVGGTMTGDSRGACKPLSGTPYVGADQFAAACPATAAEPGQADYPQSLDGAAPWGQFSVASPSHAADRVMPDGSVTGTRYEQGRITGPFGMADGQVTGTEEFRFGRGRSEDTAPARPAVEQPVEAAAPSRVTGEGMELNNRITGDDWDRGDRVTGTEGMSATRRNPTRRGPVDAMVQRTIATPREEPMEMPMSRVTGSSGNTEKGAFVTYSGGARG